MGKSRDFLITPTGKLQEERQFTNPVVRFVRIKGRIVPIINKQKVGNITSRSGDSILKAAAVVSALPFAAKGIKAASRSKAGRKVAHRFKVQTSNQFAKFVKKGFSSSMAKFSKNSATILSKHKKTKFAINTLKGSVKHSGKLAAGLFLAGAAVKLTGLEIKARSTMGVDFLPDKDK